MKNSKVVKVTKMDKKDGYGNTSYVLDFENGDNGFYSTVNENQTKFVVGSASDYEIEEKTGKTGKTYFKIKLPQPENKFTGGGGGYQKQDPKVGMISFAMAYSKDLIVGGKCQFTDISIVFEEIYTLMVDKLEGQKSETAKPKPNDDLPF